MALADEMPAPESDPLEFPGEDLRVVMGQFQPHRVFHLEFFQHDFLLRNMGDLLY